MMFQSTRKVLKKCISCRMTAALLFLLPGILLLAGGVAAAPRPEARTYDWLPYFVGPCNAYDVPLALALAIARQESGTRPWVVNVAGASFFPATPQEALAIAEQARREGRSFDVGIMQINSYWLKKYNIPVAEVLHPQKNIAMGVWILAREIRRYGLNWQAVGAYHTPLERNPERAKHYAMTVFSHMRAICEADRERRRSSTPQSTASAD